MKKILITILFLFAIFTMSNITNSSAERSSAVNTNNTTLSDEMLLEKLNKLEKEVYTNKLMQHVEFESEIIIPEYLNAKYIEYAYNVSTQLKLPTRMVFRLMYTESRFNDTIISPMGAKGLMQLMPETRSLYYENLRVDTLKLDKNQEDIYIGLNFLKNQHEYWMKRGNSDKYSWKLTLASYNAGIVAVKKYQGIPPYRETVEFIAFILKAHSNPQFFANYIKKYENTSKNRT